MPAMRRKTLAEIEAQIAALNKQAEALREREVADVVARIRQAIAHYGLTAQDLGLTTGRGGRRAGRVAAGAVRRGAADVGAASDSPSRNASGRPARPKGVVKFRDDAGHTWTGVGKRPRWYTEALASGKTPEDLRVR